MTTLKEFIETNQFQGQWVEHSGFDSLYVRWSRPLKNTLMLANVTATNPGSGEFTKLIKMLVDSYDMDIFVESVLTSRFSNKLLSMGFILYGDNNYLLNRKK